MNKIGNFGSSYQLLENLDSNKKSEKSEEEFQITKPLSLSLQGKIAVISGAGLTGLAASIQLKEAGYEVFVLEQREDFTRCNIINLNREVQPFLRKYNLLEDFEKTVAARIQQHQIVNVGKNGSKILDTSDVSQLNFEGSLPKDPEKFKDLFKEDGIYSVQIKRLQSFLAEKAGERGVNILKKATINILMPLSGEKLSKVEIKQGNSTSVINPELVFIAEGDHSTSVEQCQMSTDLVENDCSGENWIFGNLKYSGDETFVVSVIDTSKKTLQIANVIFNAKEKLINLAVTSGENPKEEDIVELISSVAQKVFDFKEIKEKVEILHKVAKPVKIINRKASTCSIDNVFRIGNAAGSSSPLAGLGGSLCFSLVPIAVKKVLKERKKNLEMEKLHMNFEQHTKAYVTKWIDKSQAVKKIIVNFFEKTKEVSDEN